MLFETHDKLMSVPFKTLLHNAKLRLSEDFVLSLIKVYDLVDLLSVHEEGRALHLADELVHAEVSVNLFKVVDQTAFVFALDVVLDFL